MAFSGHSILVAALVASIGLSAFAQAQDYPAKVVREQNIKPE